MQKSMYDDHEFDPVTQEELAEREREAELARKIRREVMRVKRGEADEDIRADEQQQSDEQLAEKEREGREKKRRSSAFWLLFSGNILVNKGVAGYYRYMMCVALMFFLSIMVMFWSLHLDMRYGELERRVQMLRERSVRLREQKSLRTTHSAIVEQLRSRGIELYDPVAPGAMIDEDAETTISDTTNEEGAIKD